MKTIVDPQMLKEKESLNKKIEAMTREMYIRHATRGWISDLDGLSEFDQDVLVKVKKICRETAKIYYLRK